MGIRKACNSACLETPVVLYTAEVCPSALDSHSNPQSKVYCQQTSSKTHRLSFLHGTATYNCQLSVHGHPICCPNNTYNYVLETVWPCMHFGRQHHHACYQHMHNSLIDFVFDCPCRPCCT